MTQLLHYPHSSQSVPLVAAYKYNIKLFFQTDDVKKIEEGKWLSVLDLSRQFLSDDHHQSIMQMG